MTLKEVFSKRSVVILVIFFGLIMLGTALFEMKFKRSPGRIWVEGIPVEIGSRSLHPEQTKVEATAWFKHGELNMDVKLMELDANGTYCFLQISLNPHPGKEPGEETTFEASKSFSGYDKLSEGDVIHIYFPTLGSSFKIRDGNKIDAVLPLYVLKEKLIDGVSLWIDYMYVGEIEFSVEVQEEEP